MRGLLTRREWIDVACAAGTFVLLAAGLLAGLETTGGVSW